jgi:hypothetical protein
MSPLDRLVSLGFNRTVSHNMLIVVRGNFNGARAALENLSSDPQAMALFASSIPIVKCDQVNRLGQFMKELQPRDPSIFEVMYMPAGGLSYAFTRIDLQEYKFCDLASEQLRLQSVVLDDLSNFPPEAVEFYQRRWSPDPEGESTFLMEGLSQAEARTLMKLARGRYLMAWLYFHGYQTATRHLPQATAVISDLEGGDELIRVLCRAPDVKLHFILTAKSFMAMMLIPDSRAPIAAACQDFREFFQRNPDMLS